MRSVICTTIVAMFLMAATAGATCPGNHGTELGSFRGGTAYSNGTDQSCYDGQGTYGYYYQCVEYVKRFYGQEVGDPITQPWGTASQAYDLGSGSVNKYAQGGTMAPEVGDVLCFAI